MICLVIGIGARLSEQVLGGYVNDLDAARRRAQLLIDEYYEYGDEAILAPFDSMRIDGWETDSSGWMFDHWSTSDAMTKMPPRDEYRLRWIKTPQRKPYDFTVNIKSPSSTAQA